MTSPQIEREVGGRIKEARGWTVNLDEPDLEIHVELLTDQAFYFFGKARGPGGLPTGTAGRVVCLLSGGMKHFGVRTSRQSNPSCPTLASSGRTPDNRWSCRPAR